MILTVLIPQLVIQIWLYLYIALIPFKGEANACGGVGEPRCFCTFNGTTLPNTNEVAHTWSSLGFVAAGTIASVHASWRKIALLDGILMPTLLVQLGPASMFLHGFTTIWGEYVDSAAIALLLAYLLGRSVYRILRNPLLRLIVTMIAVVALIVCVFLTSSTVNYILASAGTGIIWAMELVHIIFVDSQHCGKVPFILSTILLALSVAFHVVGWLVCTESIYDIFHTLWHIASAGGLLAFYFYLEAGPGLGYNKIENVRS